LEEFYPASPSIGRYNSGIEVTTGQRVALLDIFPSPANKQQNYAITYV